MTTSSAPAEPTLLRLARRIQALAQNGLTYTEGVYDRERYTELLELAAELMALQSDTPVPVIRDLFLRQTGYATPKVDVRAAVFQADQVLLVQEDEDGLWTLPGGWADVNDAPSHAVRREVFEEAGLQVRVTKLAMVLDRSLHPHQPPFPFHVYKLFFLCEPTGGTLRPGTGIRQAGFFPRAGLPPLSLTRVLPEQIHRLFEHAANPALPTDFD
ncbi:NUDIX hydrolase [Limisphaera ngatamarikiensis]|uniref:NUDIX hydrolase n=1 Tax=Limisphaera ngatamarikiensis TaxID=1324935 RepID=A0A6M1RN71_9BACT|nr:NUDIX hydrolase [Limisphaera ngatamarikiensis]NGO38887.1 NUDIX hydrolase [Limisphaera ngatamarikiensis]